MREQVGVPNDLLDAESVDKMLIILFPCITSRPAYVAMKKSPLFRIFRENNYTLRTKFFSDPLIKFLWRDLFVKKREDILVTHLRRIRSLEVTGQTKYERFVKDLRINESRHGVTLLPNSAKEAAKVAIFSEEEALTDLLENGKYNKRQAKRIRIDIAKMRKNSSLSLDSLGFGQEVTSEK